MPRWLRWLLKRSTYTHIYDLNTAACWERAGLCVLIKINSDKASPCHPFFTLSLLYRPFFFLPLSPATFIHLHSPPFMTSPSLSIPLSQYSFPHISHHPSLFLPFTSLVLALLSSPLILIISTFRLPLAAFSLLASALLSLIHSAPAHCLSLACSSAHLSPFCLRLAEMDTLPGKQVKKNRLKGGRKWEIQWRRTLEEREK